MRKGIVAWQAAYAFVLVTAVGGCAYISMDLGRLVEMQPFEERVIREGGPDKVLVLEILGPITTTAFRDGFMPRQGTLERLDSILELAGKDRRIKGVILKIDSPGGGITASNLLYREILEYKEKRRTSVVACITGQGTSGAYMAALAADSIVALPTSVVGNVGVLLPSISLEGLMDKLGIKNQTLTSGKLKDAGTILRDMNDEDRELLEGIVREFHEDFLDKVRHRRPVSESDLEVIADGRVMTASVGMQHHLVDEVGYYEDALKAVERLANVSDPTVVVYRRRTENRGGFYSWP